MILFDDINKLKITTKQKELFKQLDLNSIFEVLSYYPSRYNFIEETPLLDNTKVVVDLKIVSQAKISFFQGKKSRISFEGKYQNEIVKVIIFNRHFIFKNILNNTDIVVIGVYTKNNNTIIAQDIKFNTLANIKGIYPVYSLVNNYKNADYLKIISKIIKESYSVIDDIIPSNYKSKYKLLSKKDALKNIHFPQNKEYLIQANRSLIYEEFFIFALKTIIINKKRKKTDKYRKEININDLHTLVDSLQYTLTKDQKAALNDIYKDLISTTLMNRLILADVGSGKTLVALIASYMVYMSGYQCAFMAPTTILAMQHYYSAMTIFKDFELNISLLTSNTSDKEREAILLDLKKGKIDLIIGTHSLYQDDVDFKNLGLIIIDEQQRFGVKQRKALKDKGLYTEQLMLSATPIPRTLAQVAYASIQSTFMKDTLPFKKQIKSYYFQSKSIKPFYEEMINLLNKRQQIYIVTPLVEESENIDTKNAISVFESISKHFNEKYRVGLIHGKLDNKQKEEVMNKFSSHEIDILISTSLIEVGISVDNANCIIIYDAHRFGLSQLHQLRGRVGRGSEQGYCVFLSSSKDEDTIKKMKFISSTNDGFKIAEYDLESRGPGDILGLKQSGIPSFNIANPIKDEKIYKKAYEDALEFINNIDEFKNWYQKNSKYLTIFNNYVE